MIVASSGNHLRFFVTFYDYFFIIIFSIYLLTISYLLYYIIFMLT